MKSSTNRRIRLGRESNTDHAVDHLHATSLLSPNQWCCWIVLLVIAACFPVPVQGQQPTITFPSTPSIVIIPSPVVTPTSLGPVASQPIAAPVVRPVAEPVSQPVTQPVTAPVKPPTPRPTFPRTKSPTPSPTPWPSRAPSEIPSIVPTFEPTPKPTRKPTPRPSDAPSILPSHLPTFLETTQSPTTPLMTSEPSGAAETPSPTALPLPTLLPNIPTERPSIVPSATPPSMRPTVARPSSVPLSSEIVNVIMLLESMNGLLRGRAAIDFESATAAHIEQTTESNGYQIANFTVETTINNQEVVESDRRQLQSVAPLQVALSILIEYQDSSQNDPFDPALLVEEAFNSDEERNSYIARLKEKNTEFSTLESVSLLVDGEKPEEEAVEPTKSKNLGIIFGGIVGGVVGLALAAFFFSRRSQQYQDPPSKQVYTETALTGSEAPNRIQTEIVVDRQDDVSTLGDPVFTGVMAMDVVDRDERTASVADDYDYAKEYLMGQARERLLSVDSGPSGKTTATFPRVFADDASFEQQYEDDQPPEDKKFEVHVPPGKLGMVIDTPNGGVPIVHAIKPESVLADKVVVGDRLISVDGEDVTSMTAVQVSKLISVKSNEDRILKFVRNRSVIDSLGR
ncbi:hypothetical protein FisN_25Lh150 [Fistulifera solaris]|uniref:PDZ domain-containing protein n=1 Tax=Fistulifera solaris TaxID=1519565 RepID=A0A1Z5J7W6_FISSO|nr:hypothetical protein FisN_25Lh150 [Fistulifera solaris]|eukprot:GAX10002.1 hypothetical protein FisN_25Lh150 [Fistulifera solaris]